MADTLSKELRSWNMSRIKAKNTQPEITVRKLLHRLGYRFRIHVNKLPGTPDIVLSKYMTAIFVHGCFWHQHLGCKYAYKPKSNQDFWEKKFEKNAQKHEKATLELKKLGWRILTLWECEIKDLDNLKNLVTIIGGRNG